jgi:hypothetical protein
VSDPLAAAREAERLVREATERAEAMAREVPPRGYEAPAAGEGPGTPPPFPDLSALTGLLELARTSLPPDLQRQLAQALRELLIALRAVLDYSIQRLDPGPPPSTQVEDIPVE